MSSMKQRLGYSETFSIVNQCLNQRDDIVLALEDRCGLEGLSCFYFEVSFLYTGAEAIQFLCIPYLAILC